MRFALVVVVWMSPWVTFARQQVSGTIVGQWSKDKSPYIVVGDIFVAELTIEPGVEIIFHGEYLFEVGGILEAIGTEGQPITFTKLQGTSGWKGIFFNFSSPLSKMAYCIVSYSQNGGITIDSSSPDIRDCLITLNTRPGMGGGIYITGSSDNALRMERCIISQNSVSASAGPGGLARAYGGGIYSNVPLMLINCIVAGNTCKSSAGGSGSRAWSRGGGIYVESILTAVNTLIQENSSIASGAGMFNKGGHAQGGGIFVPDEASANIENCIISSNEVLGSRSNLGGGILAVNTKIANTSIAFNNNQGLATPEEANTLLENTIVFFNGNDQIYGNPVTKYSNIQNGYEGLGNLNQNPVFVDEETLKISPGSPCIDAGNPDEQFNEFCQPPSLGSPRNDMGAYGGPLGCDWNLPELALGSPTRLYTRIIPHVTRSSGDFTSRIIMANLSKEPQNVTLTGFGEEGLMLKDYNVKVEAHQTLYRTLEELFGAVEISHIRTYASSAVVLNVEYQSRGDGKSSAQVRESLFQTVKWRIYPGSHGFNWDGIAVVNMGDQSTGLSIIQYDASHTILGDPRVLDNLDPNAKALFVISDLFADTKDTYFELNSDQPVAITALRGDLPSSISLWENVVIPLN